MELRVPRYFLAVAREESITAAAERLNITQPTLFGRNFDWQHCEALVVTSKPTDGHYYHRENYDNRFTFLIGEGVSH